MIKVNAQKGVEIKGNSLTIAAELSAIIHFMLIDEVLPRKNIEEAIKYAFKCEEELEFNQRRKDEKDVKEVLKKMIDELFN